jgi:capsid protein
MVKIVDQVRQLFSRTASVPTVDVNQLNAWAASGYSGSQVNRFDGEKFPGGFGATQLLTMDYWTLRERSAQLFTENLYARGIVRRLITNEINTGLSPDCSPDEGILGLEPDSLLEWTETVENRFGIWGKDATVCDYKMRDTLGALQRAARLEALVSGDLLVVLRQSPITRTPQVQLVDGASVCTPLASRESIPSNHTIMHGVQKDGNGRIYAYWVRDLEGQFEQILARGKRSGRPLAWLVFGTDKRLDDTRGVPLLGIVLQSLKEIDRYRDSAQRKAVVNSILAMFIKKTEAKAGSLPITGGAARNSTAVVSDDPNSDRSFNISESIPGVVIEELAHGEEPVGFGNTGTDINFSVFENAVLNGIGWALEIPPEILVLSFQNNYSASQAAINEFKIYLNKVWSDWGETFCTPIYIEFLLSEVLNGKIPAPGLLEAWRDPSQWDVYGAWVSVQWYGSIKPSTDMLKQAKGSKLLVDEAWSTNAREARMNTGTKFSKNVAKLKRENEQKVEAMRPMAEFAAEFAATEEEKPGEAPVTPSAVADILDEYMEERGLADA